MGKSASSTNNMSAAAAAVGASPAIAPIQERCGFCQGSHRTEICNTIANLNGEQRYKKLVAAGLCTRCTGKHHFSICSVQPVCIICQGGHLTMTHSDVNPCRRSPPRRTRNNAGDAAAPYSASLPVEPNVAANDDNLVPSPASPFLSLGDE